AASLSLRITGDHELLAAVRLDLQPLAGALALPVRRVDTLGDHPLQPLLAGCVVERPAVLERLREPNGRVAPVEQPLQPLTPPRPRRYALRQRRQHGAILARYRTRGVAPVASVHVAFLDQKPVLRVAVQLRRHQRP